VVSGASGEEAQGKEGASSIGWVVMGCGSVRISCLNIFDFDQGVCYLFGIQYWCETAGSAIYRGTSKSRGGAVKLF
jgi:hypothetical protein